jgi:hypothetical protein
MPAAFAWADLALDRVDRAFADLLGRLLAWPLLASRYLFLLFAWCQARRLQGRRLPPRISFVKLHKASHDDCCRAGAIGPGMV